MYKEKIRNLYPVFLDISAKRCVIVGGGRVAERRVKSLLECEALVQVISPQLSENLEQMADNKLIEVVKRDFRSGDLEGVLLAIASSDQAEINMMVVEEARRSGILVDNGTEPTEGNFILPAVVRSGGLAIAISTGGGSPTLSRMIREELEQSLGPEHAALIELVSEVRREFRRRGISIPFESWRSCIDSELLDLIKRDDVTTARETLVRNLESGGKRNKAIMVIGVNHKAAPIEVRERLAFGSDQLENAHRLLTGFIDQGVILSTCNRSEVYALVADSDEGAREIGRFLSESCGVPPDEFSSYLYTCLQGDAVKHLFKVSSGLDSMILGDEQIRGQVRQALEAAMVAGSLHHPFVRLFEQSLRVGRQVRNESEIGKYGASTSYAGIVLAKEVFGEIDDCSALIIGAGQVGRLTAGAMKEAGIHDLTIISRTYGKASALAERFNAVAATFARLTECLAKSDIVISCTGASGFILSLDEVKEAMGERGNRPLLLIDISVPRDIDPQAKILDNVFLYDIDDLEAFPTQCPGENKLSTAEAIVDSEAAKFMEWWHSLELVPTIVALRGKAEHVRQSEVNKSLGKMPALPEDDRARIEALTRSIVNKILHHSTVGLRDKDRGHRYRLMIEELFVLGDER